MIQQCPECDGKLSTLAGMCPHCGYLQNAPPAHVSGTRTSSGFGVLWFVVLLVAAGFGAFAYLILSTSKPSPSYSAPAATTPYYESPSPPTYPGKVRATCLLCKGSGSRKSPAGYFTTTCPACNGTGSVGP